MVYPPSLPRPANLWRAARPLALAVPILCCGLACCGPGAAEADAATAEARARVALGPQPGPGEFVVDVRPPEAFAAGHLPGAINLQWQFGQFALRAQRLFPAGSKLSIVGEDAAVEASVADARRMGFTAQRGPQWPAEAAADGGAVQRLEVLTVAQLEDRLDRGEVWVSGSSIV